MNVKTRARMRRAIRIVRSRVGSFRATLPVDEGPSFDGFFVVRIGF